MRVVRILAVMLVVGMIGNGALAQSARTLKEQLIGTWTFVVAEITAADGSKSLPFGDTPKGILVFTPEGHFAQIHVASDVPRIASNNRMTGTPEEYKAINQRSLSLFGTYTVDEDKKTVTYNITSSTFPNWEGASQTRVMELVLTAEEFKNTNPSVTGGPRIRFQPLQEGKVDHGTASVTGTASAGSAIRDRTWAGRLSASACSRPPTMERASCSAMQRCPRSFRMQLVGGEVEQVAVLALQLAHGLETVDQQHAHLARHLGNARRPPSRSTRPWSGRRHTADRSAPRRSCSRPATPASSSRMP